jgi:biopolymer transport protein ExbD
MSTSLNGEDGDHGFQIAPMVDIVFVLLLFFMTYKSVKELHVEVSPSGNKVSEQNITSVKTVVDIHGDDSVYVNGTLMATPEDNNFESLSKWLELIRSTTIISEEFVIKATDQTRHERVVRIVSILNKAGYKKVTFS